MRPCCKVLSSGLKYKLNASPKLEKLYQDSLINVVNDQIYIIYKYGI